MIRKLIQKNAVLLDQALYSGSSFALTIVLGRALNLSQFGLFSSFILASFLVVSISQAFVIQPMQTRVSQLLQDLSYAAFLQRTLFIFIGIALAITLFSAFFFASFTQLDASMIVAFGVYLCLFLLHDFYRKLYLAKGDGKKAMQIDFIYAVFLCTALIVIVSSQVYNLTAIFYLLSMAFLPANLFAFFQNKRGINTRIKNGSYGAFHAREGKWFVMATLSQWFSGNIFVLSAGAVLNLEVLGALRLVQTVFGVLNIFLQSVENYIIPKVNLLMADSLEKGQMYLNRLLRKSLLLFLPVLLVLFLFSKEWMVLIGGEKYVEYHLAIRGFAILYFIIFLLYPVRILIRSLGYNKSFFYGYLITLLFGAVSSHFLLHTFSLNGAVIGFVINQLILCLVWLIYLSKNQIKTWKLYI